MVLKLVKRHIGEFKKYMWAAPGLVVVEVILDVLIPTVMASLIDLGVDKGDLNTILKIGATLVSMALVSMGTGILAGRYAAVASSGLVRNVRKAMFRSVQTFSFSNIDKFSSSSIITRLTTDLSYVVMSFQTLIRLAVRAPLMVVFAFFMSYRLNANLAMIYALVIPFVGIAFYFIISRVHPVFQRVFKTYDKLNRVVQENLAGIRVVKSFVREDHEKKKFGDVSGEIYADFVKAERITAFTQPLMQCTISICTLLLAWIGGRMIVGGDMTTGNLVSMFAYTAQMLANMMMLSMVFVMMIISAAPVQRILEILNEKSDLVNPENPVTNLEDGSVVFTDVDFSYVGDNEKRAIRKVSLSVQSGEVVGILGSTGAGKSTLVQLIPRLYDVTGGSVTVGGHDVRAYDLDSLRSQVAMILQKNVLFSGTIKENLRWGNPDATEEELIRICKLAQAHEFISELPEGYDTHVEQGGTNFSGGQKQRLCIARALLKKPKIIIFDDSTSAVDTHTDALLRKALREEIPGTTKFFIVQRISSIEDADKIIVLNDGAVESLGTHTELLEKSEIYREVYHSQQQAVS